ncbi:LRR receptor-like serine/threonine-protein kinase [Populus alba x Populus x berolinensis]|uniref:LRR receptor-like serine/threonine-protein kinase n=1 Tax=Populus alba x Populus x berolinensis TaxID=444605 RepID=A0AAD6Q6E9_9ROSI|nr:LRR receptor-like serine/threonine-protein kinase [Populus alba x Populus x berolinensis]
MPAPLRNLLFSPSIFSFTLLLSINSLFFPSCYSIDEQGQALLAWKNSLNTSTDVLNSWNPLDSSPCKWFGVHCNSDGNIIEMNLKSVDLQGPLPSNFQPLKSLKSLILSSTNLTGAIPEAFGDYLELTLIDLSDNSLSGEIPEEICRLRKLETLSLNTNFLEGAIPSDIGNLSSLVYLTLFDNQLSGEIPQSIGALRRLQIFRAGLAETSISGSLPSSIGMLKRIQTIAIYATLLSGAIPEAIGDCSELQNLYLYQNSISGPIPRRIGELSKLQSLLLWQNSIVGAIPDELGSCTELTVIDLSENLLTGSIPRSFGNLLKLEELQLSVNQLSGTIPVEITNCTALTHLEVDNNGISGEIPAGIGNLKSLTLFFAWKNNLTGNIPESLSECVNLQALDLSYNSLFGNCTNLYRLRLNGNRLGGTIPSEIEKLKSLNFIDLSNNLLVGGIPSSVSGCENLEFLDLHSNGISGSVPDTLPKSYRGIPAEILSCSKLQLLNLGDNDFSGEIPRNLVKSITEISLNLSCNQFSGKIHLNSLISASWEYLTSLTTSLKEAWMFLQISKTSFPLMSPSMTSLQHHRPLGTGANTRSAMRLLMSVLLSAGVALAALEFVYRVTLPNWEMIAVKKMWSSEESGAFNSEIRTLGSIRHRNIGGAEWEARYDVLLGVAHALAYLHHDCVPPILHGDVKRCHEPSPRPQLAGSYGYMAPEHASMQRITEKSDVYSFGVVLLEFRLRCPGCRNSGPLNFRFFAIVRHFDAPVAEILLPLNFGAIPLEVMYATATCSTSDNLLSANAKRLGLREFRGIPPFDATDQTFFRKQRNSFENSRLFLHTNGETAFDFVIFIAFRPSMPPKRFDSVSFAAFRLCCPGCRNSRLPLNFGFATFRLRCPVCRNSVAFEFRVIPLEHVIFAAFRLRCPAKRFDSLSFAAFRLRCRRCRNSVAFEFLVIPLEHFRAFRLRCPGCRNSVAFEFRVIPVEHVCFCYLFYITLPSGKRRNALTRMYAYATCSTSHFLPQRRNAFDSLSFAAFRLRCPGFRNSVAFEFRVIPLEHVCFYYLFYITLPSANDEDALTR